MKVKNAKLCLLSGVLMAVTPASAVDMDNARVKRLMFDKGYGERLFIELETRQPTPIACHTNGSWNYVLSTSDELGKQMYSAILSAYMAGKTVHLRGSDKCTNWSNIEDLDGVVLK